MSLISHQLLEFSFLWKKFSGLSETSRNVYNVNDIQVFLKTFIEDLFRVNFNFDKNSEWYIEKVSELKSTANTDDFLLKKIRSSVSNWVSIELKRYLLEKTSDFTLIKELPSDSPDWLIKKVELNPAYLLSANLIKINLESLNLQSELNRIKDYLNINLSKNPYLKLKGKSFDMLLRDESKWVEETKKKADDKEDIEGIDKVTLLSMGRLTWVELISEKSLAREGDNMNHCVGGYWGKVQSNKCRIFSLRSKNNSHCTIEYLNNEDYINQIKGKNNRPCVPKYWDNIVEFLNKLTHIKIISESTRFSKDLEMSGIVLHEGKFSNGEQGIPFNGKITALEEIPEKDLLEFAEIYPVVAKLFVNKPEFHEELIRKSIVCLYFLPNTADKLRKEAILKRNYALDYIINPTLDEQLLCDFYQPKNILHINRKNIYLRTFAIYKNLENIDYLPDVTFREIILFILKINNSPDIVSSDIFLKYYDKFPYLKIALYFLIDNINQLKVSDVKRVSEIKEEILEFKKGIGSSQDLNSINRIQTNSGSNFEENLIYAYVNKDFSKIESKDEADIAHVLNYLEGKESFNRNNFNDDLLQILAQTKKGSDDLSKEKSLPKSFLKRSLKTIINRLYNGMLVELTSDEILDVIKAEPTNRPVNSDLNQIQLKYISKMDKTLKKEIIKNNIQIYDDGYIVGQLDVMAINRDIFTSTDIKEMLLNSSHDNIPKNVWDRLDYSDIIEILKDKKYSHLFYQVIPFIKLDVADIVDILVKIDCRPYFSYDYGSDKYPKIPVKYFERFLYNTTAFTYLFEAEMENFTEELLKKAKIDLDLIRKKKAIPYLWENFKDILLNKVANNDFYIKWQQKKTDLFLTENLRHDKDYLLFIIKNFSPSLDLSKLDTKMFNDKDYLHLLKDNTDFEVFELIIKNSNIPIELKNIADLTYYFPIAKPLNIKSNVQDCIYYLENGPIHINKSIYNTLMTYLTAEQIIMYLSKKESLKDFIEKIQGIDSTFLLQLKPKTLNSVLTDNPFILSVFLQKNSLSKLDGIEVTPDMLKSISQDVVLRQPNEIYYKWFLIQITQENMYDISLNTFFSEITDPFDLLEYVAKNLQDISSGYIVRNIESIIKATYDDLTQEQLLHLADINPSFYVPAIIKGYIKNMDHLIYMLNKLDGMDMNALNSSLYGSLKDSIDSKEDLYKIYSTKIGKVFVARVIRKNPHNLSEEDLNNALINLGLDTYDNIDDKKITSYPFKKVVKKSLFVPIKGNLKWLIIPIPDIVIPETLREFSDKYEQKEIIIMFSPIDSEIDSKGKLTALILDIDLNIFENLEGYLIEGLIALLKKIEVYMKTLKIERVAYPDFNDKKPLLKIDKKDYDKDIIKDLKSLGYKNGEDRLILKSGNNLSLVYKDLK